MTYTTGSIKVQREKMSFVIFMTSVTKYRQIVKHISVHWLSLECAVERDLQQYSTLKSCFYCLMIYKQGFNA